MFTKSFLLKPAGVCAASPSALPFYSFLPILTMRSNATALGVGLIFCRLAPMEITVPQPQPPAWSRSSKRPHARDAFDVYERETPRRGIIRRGDSLSPLPLPRSPLNETLIELDKEDGSARMRFKALGRPQKVLLVPAMLHWIC